VDFLKIKKVDPISQETLDAKDLITNLNVKHATEDYLAKNPWIFEFLQNEKIEQLRLG
jgi:hypothetical protein